MHQSNHLQVLCQYLKPEVLCLLFEQSLSKSVHLQNTGCSKSNSCIIMNLSIVCQYINVMTLWPLLVHERIDRA